MKFKVIFTIALCYYVSLLSAQTGLVNTVYFNLDSYKIDKQYSTTLDAVEKQCKSDTLVFMRIFAFADTTGSTRHNEELAKKRAYQVYNYLVSRFGIDTTKDQD